MATFKDGYMGALNGKLGPAVAYTWKGRQCFRAYQPKPKDPQTEKQIKCRIIFGKTSQLASDMQLATKIGFRCLAEERQSGITNIFVSLNRHCVSVDDGIVNIDYASLKVAEGELAPVDFGEPLSEGDGKVGVTFSTPDDNCGYYNDHVYLFAYNPTKKRSALSFPTPRYSERVGLRVPTSWHGHDVHLYGFTWNQSLVASSSTYIGSITIE